MPEVVEVKKYADFLKKKCKGKFIHEINILNGRYKKQHN
jgi:formamidopyrimidine-DNA glycosylase